MPPTDRAGDADDALKAGDADDALNAGDADDAGNEVPSGDRPVAALDASALMAPVEANGRLFEELDRLLGTYETVVPGAVVAELEGLRSGAGEAATAASVGADLASRARTVGTEESYADDALVELAAAGRADYVVTNDRPLRKRVLDADVPVICLRGRNTLAITEP